MQRRSPSARSGASPFEDHFGNAKTRVSQLDRWRRVARRTVQFFRLIRIPPLRARFIDVVSGNVLANVDGYQIGKMQEDWLFLDDVDRYREVCQAFLSFGFAWQDREFRLAKLKANYIYDRYLSTPEAIAKTNIPPAAAASVSSRMQSARALPPLSCSNLFNDAEKFIWEKLLSLFMREGMSCFTGQGRPSSIGATMNRTKKDFRKSQMTTPVSPPKALRSTTNAKEEILLPSWTYSMATGFVYDPVRELRPKTTAKKPQRKASDVQFAMAVTHPVQLPDPIASKSAMPLDHKLKQVLKGFTRSNQSTLPRTKCHRCDVVFPRKVLVQRQLSPRLFICKVHSFSPPNPAHYTLDEPATHRMTSEFPFASLFTRTSPWCS